MKARKFLGAVTAIENFEIEHVSRSKNNETGLAMTSLLPSSEEGNKEVDERGQYMADEMTFSNIAGVVAAVEKVQFDYNDALYSLLFSPSPFLPIYLSLPLLSSLSISPSLSLSPYLYLPPLPLTLSLWTL